MNVWTNCHSERSEESGFCCKYQAFHFVHCCKYLILLDAFSLLGKQTIDGRAKRKWSEAYLSLTQALPVERPDAGSFGRGNQDGELVNWINNMSVPTMLPAYYRGAAKSKLITILEKGHEGVKLSREEMDKIACWIDLVVPYCGDYTEANAWSEEEIRRYDHFMEKRRRMEKIERRNIRELTAATTPADKSH